MGGRQIVRNETLHLHRDRGFLALDFCVDVHLGRFLAEFSNPPGERMVRYLALLLPVRRLADLLRHVTGLALFAGLHRLALIPVAQQIVGLA